MLKELAEVFKFSGRKDADRFLLTMLDEMPQCVKVVAPNGELRRMNESGLRMIEADNWQQVDGASTQLLIAVEDRQKWLDKHRRVCEGEKLAWGSKS